MASETSDSLPVLLQMLARCLDSASTLVPDEEILIPPQDGISLFDSKNEMFLSYLQNLVFLILLKLRHRQDWEQDNLNKGNSLDTEYAVVKKLVELRVYMERGVRRLEGDLSYQINKVLQAANDAEAADLVSKTAIERKRKDTRAEYDAGDFQHEDESEDGSLDGTAPIDDLQYRPNLAAFAPPTNRMESRPSKSKEGIYRPPRITATAMPLPNTAASNRKDRHRNGQKSATMDEYIASEYSTVPIAEPSIGSGLTSSRRTITEKEKREERERRDYEERNFVRLPKESKKEKKEKRGRDNASQRMGYGGEEWRSLGEGVERIERLTKKSTGNGRDAVLERSRKRKLDDGSRGRETMEIGQSFQKRLKTLDRKQGQKN